MKTLQTQYNLIKEGKGQKDVFLKEAKRIFPNEIRKIANFNEASDALKRRGIITEHYVDLKPINSMTPTKKSSWEDKFTSFLSEEVKATEKKTSKEVEDIQVSGYDNSDKENIDNIYGERFLTGYYAEMKDPKNADKTVEELKAIVAKNLTKDELHYVKDGQFGVKGIGYEEKEMEEVSGKHKSSGYSDKLKTIKEIKMQSLVELIKENEAAKAAPKEKKTAKKGNLDSKLAEIEKAGKLTTMEAQIDAIDEMIEGKESKLKMISEDENLADLIDKKKQKEMQREIKLLGKKKATMEKMYEKMCGKAYKKTEVIDEDSVNEIGMFHDPRMSSGRFDHLTSSGDDEPSEGYMKAKLEAEERVDNGEEIEDVVRDYPEFREMLFQDLKGKYGM